MTSLTTCSLFEALLDRRSSRFAPGFRLNGGPLAFESQRPASPLSLEEEAELAFAANGVTGFALSELPFGTGDLPAAGGGHIMVHFVGRTVASGDAMHLVAVFVVNDAGAWMLRRPQDYSRAEIPELVRLARDHRLVELYERARIPLAEHRVDVPRELPFIAPFNKWSANLPGTTYFVPIAELTVLYINVLLSFLDEEWAFFFVDDHHGYVPAGIGAFGRSRGGHLYDDPRDGRVATVTMMEGWIREFGVAEMGAIVQNLGLAAAALGVGGFPHFAGYPAIWPHTLGFRMEAVPYSRIMGAGGGGAGEPTVPTAITAWKDGSRVQAGIPKYSEGTIAATIPYCTYIYERYGRFPAVSGPFASLIAYQAHHLDADFYDHHYRPEALADSNRHHQARWHPG